eukprot:106822-Rhodomonas_salina.1
MELDDKVQITHPGLRTWFASLLQQCLPVSLRPVERAVPKHVALKRWEPPPQPDENPQSNLSPSPPRTPNVTAAPSAAPAQAKVESPSPSAAPAQAEVESPSAHNTSTSLAVVVDQPAVPRWSLLTTLPKALLRFSTLQKSVQVESVLATKQQELAALTERIEELERRREAATLSCEAAEASASNARSAPPLLWNQPRSPTISACNLHAHLPLLPRVPRCSTLTMRAPLASSALRSRRCTPASRTR